MNMVSLVRGIWMCDSYAKMALWAKYIGLIRNRAAVASQVCGARYDGSPDSPIVLRDKACRYWVDCCGSTIAEFELYDIDGARLALERVDALKEGLWQLRRADVMMPVMC